MDKHEIARRMEHSETKPRTYADHKLSIRHLRKRIAFNLANARDHEKLLAHGGSKEYNKNHIEHHEESVKKDEKLIKERQKSIKKAHE